MKRTFDVIVAGAGTAGANAALQCARRGLTVACFDARPLAGAGARWVGAQPAWLYPEMGLAPPQPPELLDGPTTYRTVVGWDRDQLAVQHSGIPEVDLRLFVDRLQREAEGAGARFVGDAAVHRVDGRRVTTSAGEFSADWVVDASGMNGARLAGQRPVDPRHICDATHSLRRVEDRAAAEGFLARHGARWGESLGFVGVAGGYSVFNLRCTGDRVGVLAGTVPGEGYPRSVSLIRQFVRQHHWIGDTVHSGGQAIPLRRPLDCPIRDRVAAVGDAACQVYGSHGSGVAMGMVAGKLLAEALAAGAGVEGYAATFMRGHGGTLAAMDLLRRHLQGLTPDQAAPVLCGGLVSQATMAAVLAQEPPLPRLDELPTLLGSLLRRPRLAASLAPLVTRMGLAKIHYARYPKKIKELNSWQASLPQLGIPPD